MIILKIQAAKSKAAEAPLVLWLQGGPGWSSAFGAFKEVDDGIMMMMMMMFQVPGLQHFQITMSISNYNKNEN